jgi:hypothetical protein
MRSCEIRWFLSCAALVVLLAGCQASEDAQTIAERQKYLLATEPSGAMTVIDVRSQFNEGEESAPNAQTVVMVGRVGAGANQTWDPSEAAFVI